MFYQADAICLYIPLLPVQVKHYRALQEQASTYLDLVCSVCDLSDDAVKATAAEVQQVKHTVCGLVLLYIHFWSSHCHYTIDNRVFPISFSFKYLAYVTC